MILFNSIRPAFIMMLTALAVTLFVSAPVSAQNADGSGTTSFLIERGQSAKTIGENLQAAGLIDSAVFSPVVAHIWPCCRY